MIFDIDIYNQIEFNSAFKKLKVPVYYLRRATYDKITQYFPRDITSTHDTINYVEMSKNEVDNSKTIYIKRMNSKEFVIVNTGKILAEQVGTHELITRFLIGKEQNFFTPINVCLYNNGYYNYTTGGQRFTQRMIFPNLKNDVFIFNCATDNTWDHVVKKFESILNYRHRGLRSHLSNHNPKQKDFKFEYHRTDNIMLSEEEYTIVFDEDEIFINNQLAFRKVYHPTYNEIHWHLVIDNHIIGL
jgi:hypothetical protein